MELEDEDDGVDAPPGLAHIEPPEYSPESDDEELMVEPPGLAEEIPGELGGEGGTGSALGRSSLLPAPLIGSRRTSSRTDKVLRCAASFTFGYRCMVPSQAPSPLSYPRLMPLSRLDGAPTLSCKCAGNSTSLH